MAMEYTTRNTFQKYSILQWLKGVFVNYVKVYEHLSQPWFTDGGQDRAVARRLGIRFSGPS